MNGLLEGGGPAGSAGSADWPQGSPNGSGGPAAAGRGETAEPTASPPAVPHANPAPERPANGWILLPLAAAAGLLQALAVADPWTGQPHWWLQLLSLAALVLLLQRTGGARQAGLVGWAFATAWLGATFWWLFVSMHVYGGLAAPLAVAAVLALAAALGLYLAAGCAAYRLLSPNSKGVDAIVFAALWLLTELTRGQWLTGFPWGAAGYAHVDGPLAAWAPWVGVYGIGALAAWVAATLAGITRCSRWRGVALAVVLALPTVVQQAHGGFTASAGRFSVALLQGNIPQDEKFQPGTGLATALDWYGQRLAQEQADLVVAPETAVPLLPRQLPEGWWPRLLRAYGAVDGADGPDVPAEVLGTGITRHEADADAAAPRAALLGMPLGSFDAGYTNSAVGLAPGQPPYAYHKHHLVPFGEFIPPGFRWFVRMMDIPLGDFARGPLVQPSFTWAGQQFAPNICYEDLFGEELAVRFADPAAAPTVFVNLSNIAWFGDTVAIAQHLGISRMRALEFERPMLRATNTGATAVIDHQGRVTAQLPPLTRGVLRAEAEGRRGRTPYARWAGAFGLLPLWALGLLVPAWVAVRQRLHP